MAGLDELDNGFGAIIATALQHVFQGLELARSGYWIASKINVDFTAFSYVSMDLGLACALITSLECLAHYDQLESQSATNVVTYRGQTDGFVTNVTLRTHFLLLPMRAPESVNTLIYHHVLLATLVFFGHNQYIVTACDRPWTNMEIPCDKQHISKYCLPTKVQNFFKVLQEQKMLFSYNLLARDQISDLKHLMERRIYYNEKPLTLMHAGTSLAGHFELGAT
ncbi:hypothetical protein ACJX0J_023255 [Zea mays]